MDTKRKRCTHCGKVKPLSEFHRNKRSRDGYRPDCKQCRSDGVTRKFCPAHTGQTARVICIYDPTLMYSGYIGRESFIGTLYDGNWPDGSLWDLPAETRGEHTSRWRVFDSALHEVGGDRVLVACGESHRPALIVLSEAEYEEGCYE